MLIKRHGHAVWTGEKLEYGLHEPQLNGVYFLNIYFWRLGKHTAGEKLDHFHIDAELFRHLPYQALRAGCCL